VLKSVLPILAASKSCSPLGQPFPCHLGWHPREAEYAANIIAENMLSMCADEGGKQYVLLNHIVDHKKKEMSSQ
jgi:hypothetical protein